jgi:hypothetical protein
MNEENVTIVFHGFLNLTNLEKLKLTEEINNYLDSMEREPIRAAAEEKFKQIELGANGKICKCCGR